MSSSLVIRPMSSMVAALSRFGQSLYQAPSNDIRGITQDGWGSPLQPVDPIAPPGTEPVAFQWWAGQNLLYTPRPDAQYTAADLKTLATYPLARVCIENVKDSISRCKWSIQVRRKPGETEKQAADRAKGDDNLIKLSRMFEYPDREHSWDEWVRPLLEDMLVIDAASILIRKTFKGEVAELAVIRGEMITRYIDEQGFTPIPPSPAYAQLWWGIPLVNLTTDQLLYLPRNIVPRNTLSSQLYGMSPTEQLAPEIIVGIKRLEFVTDYYTEGSIPGVLQVVPKGTSADKIVEAMQWMNSELAGNLAARRQWRMVQGFNDDGKPDQIEFTKEPLLADTYDELHTRRICFGYGTSPQRLMKMIRTEGKASGDAADIEGLLPWVTWLQAALNKLIQRKLGYTEYEMLFDPFREPDPAKEAERVTMLVSKACMTPNRALEELGDEPVDVPEADMLGVITGTGFVPIAAEHQLEQQSTLGTDADSIHQRAMEAKPEPGEGKDGQPDAKGDTPANKLTKQLRALVTSKRPTKPNGHGVAKRTHPLAIKGHRLSPQSTVAKGRMQHAVAARLKKMEEKVRAELGRYFAKVRKADSQPDLMKRLARLLGIEFRRLPGEVEEALVEAALSGALEGAMQIDITSLDLMHSINKVAREWAQDRAAEMVGMKWADDGRLIPNPRAEWQISQSTRDHLKSVVVRSFDADSPTLQSVTRAIDEAGIFSDSRAQMIARTEISRAQSQGNLTTWKESGLVGKVEWQVGSDHDHDDECDQNEADGPYDIDEVPDHPAHPNCDCILIAAEIGEGEAEEA